MACALIWPAEKTVAGKTKEGCIIPKAYFSYSLASYIGPFQYLKWLLFRLLHYTMLSMHKPRGATLEAAPSEPSSPFKLTDVLKAYRICLVRRMGRLSFASLGASFPCKSSALGWEREQEDEWCRPNVSITQLGKEHLALPHPSCLWQGLLQCLVNMEHHLSISQGCHIIFPSCYQHWWHLKPG